MRLKIENNEPKYVMLWTQNPVSHDFVCSTLTVKHYQELVVIADQIVSEIELDERLAL